MRFAVLTIHPQLFESYIHDSIIGRAVKNKIIEIEFVNIRDFAITRYKQVDDTPYGGGPGLVMMCQPVFDAIKKIRVNNKGPLVYLSPRGKLLHQSTVRRFSRLTEIILLCGRYEGIDQRIVDRLVDEEISMGNYVLTGGELPAMVFIDAVSRLLPGVLGDDSSSSEESFSLALKGKKEYPQYTKPAVYRGIKVPEVLLSGNHKEIELWRRERLR